MMDGNFDEVMKEICKSYFYGYSMEEIAANENCDIDTVKEAIDLGYKNLYFKELRERKGC